MLFLVPNAMPARIGNILGHGISSGSLNHVPAVSTLHYSAEVFLICPKVFFGAIGAALSMASVCMAAVDEVAEQKSSLVILRA